MVHATKKAANGLSGNWSESTKDSTELEILLGHTAIHEGTNGLSNIGVTRD